MRSKFYSEKYTVICKEDIPFNEFPQIKVYNTSIQEACQKIKQYECENDMFFSGHFILNNFESVDKLRALIIYTLTTGPVPKRNVIVPYVYHHGVDSKCYVDDSYMYCSSWALPFIAGTSRTSNNLYGNIMRHRLKIYAQETDRQEEE